MPHYPAPPPSLSYELFPPASAAAAERLEVSLEALAQTEPDYVSVTYSGTPHRRRATLDLVDHLVRDTRLRPLAHLTCVGESAESLAGLVRHFIGLGVRGVLAMRGDLPEDPAAYVGEYPFARYLVELIREVEGQYSAALGAGRLSVGVAAYPVRHPESPSFQHDVEVLVGKQRSGADYAITQVYFRPEDYTQLVDAARRAGVTIPIIPGVLPVDSADRLARLATLTGVEPDPLLGHALETASDEAERRRIGVEFAASLARRALGDGAPGVHVYTFNRHEGAIDLVERLDLPGQRTDARHGLAARVGA
ncbi:methylenetetrahydrofolate reductase [Galactobacter valiniphilus]|uniref:methylenetetrahydrofolate reductase n=1 Tax=Galactobacter valiniphilus TaxID=2676122 RepID=UPI003735F591